MPSDVKAIQVLAHELAEARVQLFWLLEELFQSHPEWRERLREYENREVPRERTKILRALGFPEADE